MEDTACFQSLDPKVAKSPVNGGIKQDLVKIMAAAAVFSCFAADTGHIKIKSIQSIQFFVNIFSFC